MSNEPGQPARETEATAVQHELLRPMISIREVKRWPGHSGQINTSEHTILRAHGRLADVRLPESVSPR
jgi:hypothetical protein